MKTIIYPFLLLSTALFACNNNATQQDPIPQHQSFSLASKILTEERTINVWRPNESSEADSLPVIYMADGGVKEDFPHIANTLAKLIKENKIPPVMLVGIENTERRRDLTGFTEVESDKKIAPVVGGSEQFRGFISKELFKEIENRYCTKNQKTILGESAAGLFVMETFFLEPELFDNYIAFDPSIWWNNHYLVRNAKNLLTKPILKEKRLWFAASDATDIKVHTLALAKFFQLANSTNVIWHYADEPKEQHNTIFRATKEKALIWTFSESKTPALDTLKAGQVPNN